MRSYSRLVEVKDIQTDIQRGIDIPYVYKLVLYTLILLEYMTEYSWLAYSTCYFYFFFSFQFLCLAFIGQLAGFCLYTASSSYCWEAGVWICGAVLGCFFSLPASSGKTTTIMKSTFCISKS